MILFFFFVNSLQESFKNKKHQLKFIDSLRINVKGGHGGNGYPKYGGVGGQGGCVQFLASDKLTLNELARK